MFVPLTRSMTIDQVREALFESHRRSRIALETHDSSRPVNIDTYAYTTWVEIREGLVNIIQSLQDDIAEFDCTLQKIGL